MRSAENGPDTEVPQPYSALVGSASAIENRRQEGEVQAYHPRRSNRPNSLYTLSVDPLVALKTLRLRPDSSGQHTVTRGQDRAVRAAGA
eukprot:COSAG02_NODE_693_length_18428_cov_268.516722_11_plen_89_part_00